MKNMNRDFILTRSKHVIQGVLLVTIFFLILAGSLFLWWWVRPSTYQVNSLLNLNTTNSWDAVTNGRHNANTDLIYWNGHYYFIYANQPGNQGSTTTFLSVNRGTDLRIMTQIATLNVPGQDIRDPKFAIIKNNTTNETQLFIYYLKNNGVIADPYMTAVVNSSDGLHFSVAQDVSSASGWLMWRPKTYDNKTWYDTGYWYLKGQCILLSSTDGFTWTKVSAVYNASGNDEDEMEFYTTPTSLHGHPNIIITMRVEVEKDSVFGDVNAGTGLATAAWPYTSWNYTLDKVTRLDGPNLFTVNDSSNVTHYFAVGRFQPDVDSMFTAMGSVFSRKRTSLFEFVNLSSSKPALRYISDLPSTGDTAYEGVIVHSGCVYISYYSSDQKKDYAWVLGMLLPSDIYMVNISTTSLLNAAAQPLSPPFTVPWDNYLIVCANAGFIFAIMFWLVKKHTKK